MKILEIAHRGYSEFYKDNTIEAFIKAIYHKFDMIELDIQLTKDNKIIIYHDTFIKNTNNSYFIIDLTYEEIKSINNKIPLLIDLFDILIKNKNYSAVTGSRMLKKKDALKGNMPIYKFLGNIFLTKIFNLFYQTKFSDCHTGYWAYNLNKIELSLFNNVDNRFCFDIDMRLLLTQNNLKIKEIPIKTFYGNERSSIHIIYAIRFFLKTLKFKLIGKL